MKALTDLEICLRLMEGAFQRLDAIKGRLIDVLSKTGAVNAVVLSKNSKDTMAVSNALYLVKEIVATQMVTKRI